jgi:hypothetical protein
MHMGGGGTPCALVETVGSPLMPYKIGSISVTAVETQLGCRYRIRQQVAAVVGGFTAA